MDTTTLLIIVLLILLLGGGWYGRGRWYCPHPASGLLHVEQEAGAGGTWRGHTIG
jgi:hypothetical protein